MNDEACFLHADKHQNLVQVDTTILGVCDHSQVSKIRCLHIFEISPVEHGDEVDFCLQINTKVFYKLTVSLWACLTRHAQSTQNNKFTISL